MPLRSDAAFGGRARRKDYRLVVRLGLGVFVAASVIDDMLGYGTSSTSAIDGRDSTSVSISGPVELVVALAFLAPDRAVGVRRLHDTDRRGWWVLLRLIPSSASVLIVFYCLDGTVGANRFGSDPKTSEAGRPG